MKNTYLGIALSLALVSSVLASVGCSKKEGDDPAGSATGAASTTGAQARVGSCQKLANAGKCTEYKIPDDLTASIQKGGCEATSGTWVLSACPGDKQFANCTTDGSKMFYYAGVQTPGAAIVADEEFAKLDCDMMSGKIAITGKAAPAAAPSADGPAAPAKKQTTGAAKKK